MIRPALPIGNQTSMPLSVAKNRCKNFFVTLMNLSAKQSNNLKNQMINEIQHLINGQTNPKIFVQNIRRLLNSGPTPTLVPFLSRALPELRKSLQSGEITIGE